MKRVDEPQRRYASHRAEIRAHGIERGRGCAGGVLRIKRQHEDFLAIRGAKLAERGGNRRLPVAHAELHCAEIGRQALVLDALSEITAQQYFLLGAVHEQR